MNPLGVLTARDVMEPFSKDGGDSTAAASVDAELPVKTVMDLLAKGVTELNVTDDGRKIGLVRANGLMSRLINPRHG